MCRLLAPFSPSYSSFSGGVGESDLGADIPLTGDQLKGYEGVVVEDGLVTDVVVAGGEVLGRFCLGGDKCYTWPSNLNLYADDDGDGRPDYTAGGFAAVAPVGGIARAAASVVQETVGYRGVAVGFSAALVYFGLSSGEEEGDDGVGSDEGPLRVAERVLEAEVPGVDHGLTREDTGLVDQVGLTNDGLEELPVAYVSGEEDDATDTGGGEETDTGLSSDDDVVPFVEEMAPVIGAVGDGVESAAEGDDPDQPSVPDDEPGKEPGREGEKPKEDPWDPDWRRWWGNPNQPGKLNAPPGTGSILSEFYASTDGDGDGEDIADPNSDDGYLEDVSDEDVIDPDSHDGFLDGVDLEEGESLPSDEYDLYDALTLARLQGPEALAAQIKKIVEQYGKQPARGESPVDRLMELLSDGMMEGDEGLVPGSEYGGDVELAAQLANALAQEDESRGQHSQLQGED